jgi:hypothetical protein
MTWMFRAQRNTLLVAAAGVAVGAIVMRTMPRTQRTVDTGHPDISLPDGLGDEGSSLGLPKSHRPPGLFLRSAYVFVCGGVLAVGIRVFYGVVSNVSDARIGILSYVRSGIASIGLALEPSWRLPVSIWDLPQYSSSPLHSVPLTLVLQR